jgi:copper chaperone CopZ
MPRSLLLALALAATVAFSGCAGAPSSGSSSTSKFKGDQKLVANTVEDLETASRPGRSDTGKICRDIVTPALAKQLATAGGSCEKAVDGAIKDADGYQLTVQKVVINGTTATAQVKTETGKKDRVQTVALTKAGPGWRISRFR